MAGPLRSADKAYYASKQPLFLRGTREGRKNPAPNPSYKQKANDVTASSNKYYAAMEPVATSVQPAAGQKLQTTFAPEKVATLQAKAQVLPDVVAAFQGGATTVRIEGESEDINKSRAAVEMAVGRKTLTREQSDRVVFVPVQKPATSNEVEVVSTEEAPAVPVEAEAILNPPAEVTKTPKKKTTRKKTTRKKKTNTAADVPASVPAEVQEPAAEDDSVTEADIASAFGVADDSDDFDADSDD